MKISTHTSRVGCDMSAEQHTKQSNISTHTSRVGCDAKDLCPVDTGTLFLLTHPVWDVTLRPILPQIQGIISTHTSRVGCDNKLRDGQYDGIIFLLTHPVWDVTWHLLLHLYACQNFYSHIPCGM